MIFFKAYIDSKFQQKQLIPHTTMGSDTQNEHQICNNNSNNTNTTTTTTNNNF